MVLSIFLIGFLLSGACYGGNLFLQSFCIKKKLYWLQRMSMVIISIIPTIIKSLVFVFPLTHFILFRFLIGNCGYLQLQP